MLKRFVKGLQLLLLLRDVRDIIINFWYCTMLRYTIYTIYTIYDMLTPIIIRLYSTSYTNIKHIWITTS